LPWLVVTALNLAKPFHIDDTAHLEIARWIAQNPLHPMLGPLNWNGVEEPIHRTNQPHLLFYLMALWGRIAGFSEVAMHLLMAAFALIAATYFDRLARLIAPSLAWILTPIFVLGPAFAVSQNMMVDVPLIAVWNAFFYYLVVPASGRQAKVNAALAGLFCGAALLIKYSSLILLPAMVLVPLARRRLSLAAAVLIPLAILVLWVLFNFLDYGGVHLQGRVRPPLDAARIVEWMRRWIGAFGGIFTASVFFFPHIAGALWPPLERYVRLLIGIGVALAIAAVVTSYIADSVVAGRVLTGIIYLNGVVGLGLIVGAATAWCIRLPAAGDQERVLAVSLLYWAAASAGFYVLVAPFIAVRHILTTLPAILLLLGWFAVGRYRVGLHGRFLGRAAIAFSLFLTLALGVSDYEFARFFREAPTKLKANPLLSGRTVWFTGHWGWQWYASHVGFRQLDTAKPAFAVGDYVLVTEGLRLDGTEYTYKNLGATIETNHGLRPVFEETQRPSWTTFFCTAGISLFYSSTRSPWTLTRHCISRVRVFEVRPPQASPWRLTAKGRLASIRASHVIRSGP
jgi:hypothetical protein